MVDVAGDGAQPVADRALACPDARGGQDEEVGAASTNLWAVAARSRCAAGDTATCQQSPPSVDPPFRVGAEALIRVRFSDKPLCAEMVWCEHIRSPGRGGRDVANWRRTSSWPRGCGEWSRTGQPLGDSRQKIRAHRIDRAAGRRGRRIVTQLLAGVSRTDLWVDRCARQ